MILVMLAVCSEFFKILIFPTYETIWDEENLKKKIPHHLRAHKHNPRTGK